MALIGALELVSLSASHPIYRKHHLPIGVVIYQRLILCNKQIADSFKLWFMSFGHLRGDQFLSGLADRVCLACYLDETCARKSYLVT